MLPPSTSECSLRTPGPRLPLAVCCLHASAPQRGTAIPPARLGASHREKQPTNVSALVCTSLPALWSSACLHLIVCLLPSGLSALPPAHQLPALLLTGSQALPAPRQCYKCWHLPPTTLTCSPAFLHLSSQVCGLWNVCLPNSFNSCVPWSIYVIRACELAPVLTFICALSRGLFTLSWVLHILTCDLPVLLIKIIWVQPLTHTHELMKGLLITHTCWSLHPVCGVELNWHNKGDTGMKLCALQKVSPTSIKWPYYRVTRRPGLTGTSRFWAACPESRQKHTGTLKCPDLH